jgi:hypothetical protein
MGFSTVGEMPERINPIVDAQSVDFCRRAGRFPLAFAGQVVAGRVFAQEFSRRRKGAEELPVEG